MITFFTFQWLKNNLLFFCCLLFLISCSSKGQLNPEQKREIQDSIAEKYLKSAMKYGVYSRERQEEIDKGLAVDSTIAYLWQQKAMPLFKQGKYELGMQYLNKAVKYDRASWQGYRAFIKCIFAKTYKAAIADFEDCKAREGNNYVMDHSYDFYIAISKLQLNQFKEAENILTIEVKTQKEKNGEEWVHYLDLFYLGIAQMEQKKYTEAINTFNQSLKLYPQFPDALFYKNVCLRKIGKGEQADLVFKEAKNYVEKGYSIGEDNAIYERYPYQVRW